MSGSTKRQCDRAPRASSRRGLLLQQALEAVVVPALLRRERLAWRRDPRARSAAARPAHAPGWRRRVFGRLTRGMPSHLRRHLEGLDEGLGRAGLVPVAGADARRVPQTRQPLSVGPRTQISIVDYARKDDSPTLRCMGACMGAWVHVWVYGWVYGCTCVCICVCASIPT